MRPLPALLTLTLCACPPEKKKPEPEDTTPPVDTEDTHDTAPVEDPCAVLGLPKVDFVAAADDPSLYATAADFTVPTRAGDWTLSEHWTGCDVYLLIQDVPAQNRGWPTGIFERDVEDMFAALPKNAQLLFFSTGTTSEAIAASLDTIQANVEAALADMSEEDRAWWQGRIHYVTQRAQIVSGWVGRTMTSPGWGVGIDRAQRLRYIGSYADPNRYSSSYGWFEPNLSMVANEATYYNYEAERQAALDAVGADEIPLFSAARVAGAVDATVTLPDAATLASYDTLQIDCTMGCEGDGEYGDCPAWDYMAYLRVCDRAQEENPYTETPCQPAVAEVLGACQADGEPTATTCRAVEDCEDSSGVTWTCDGYASAIPADTQPGTCTSPLGAPVAATYTCNAEGTGYGDLPCACSAELGRWITTYHREGRWVHDASPLLPLIARGGTQHFQFQTSGPYELTLSLRLSNQGAATRPEELTLLYTGCDLTGDCNANYADPEVVSIPADAERVGLATVITGHGMSNPGNCAEFCDLDHIFTVDGDEGAAVVVDFPDAGSTFGCMEQVSDGTVPNQYGTWWYGRGGWCPGKQVPVVFHDITDQVTPGQDATIAYRVERNGQPYQATSSWAHTDVAAWLVVER